MLTAYLRNYLDNLDEVTVVLRKEDEALVRQLQNEVGAKENLRIVFSENSHLGMGHSIADGIQASASWQYVLLALGDMPKIQASTIQHLTSILINAVKSDIPCIAQPRFTNKNGHPVGFTHHYFTQLKKLSGDKGAKELLESNDSYLQQFNCTDPGVLWDLDHKPV